MNSSDSSVEQRRDRSPSEDKNQTNKLFITNIDGKVTNIIFRLISQKLRLNSEDYLRSMVPLRILLPREIETQNIALPLLT